MTDAGLYIHVPFCARACPYCDFDFAVERSPDATRLIAALEREAKERGVLGTEVRTVYVGGGTPSVLGPAGLTALLTWIRDAFDVAAVREFTVELNPEHVDAPLVEALAAAGVGRASLGIQSLRAEGLVQLGRAHSRARALQAIGLLREAGVEVSGDLIVGWPSQSLAMVQADVAALVETGLRHLSVYALTIEGDVPWVRMEQRGQRAAIDPQQQADAMAAARATLLREGWTHYEVASYCATADVAAEHNRSYWTSRDYVGLGPSAASAEFDRAGGPTRVRRRTNARGSAWWDSGPCVIEELTADETAAEALWLGLRLLQGVDLEQLERLMPQLDRARVVAQTRRQVEIGNLVWEDDGRRIRVADGRWLFHDEIGADILSNR